MAEDKPQDPFEIFRRLWGPLGVPVPGMAMPTASMHASAPRPSVMRRMLSTG